MAVIRCRRCGSDTCPGREVLGRCTAEIDGRRGSDLMEHPEDGCWVVLSSPSPVRAIVFNDRADAYQYAFENQSESVKFQKWGKE